jgi:hypothetical protein
MNVKMVQYAFHLVLAMNANVKMVAILENIVKTVTFISLNQLQKKLI